MWILVTTVFVASLLGSLHCVGMCGPFALLASANPENRSSSIVPTLAYSLGRLLTYSCVGFVFGLLGLAINQGGSLAGWQQAATYVAGGLMIVVGFIALVRYLGFRVAVPGFANRVERLLQSLFRRTTSLTPLKRALTIGMLTSLMPCGWLYTFAIAAAGSGNPFWGVVIMASFWLGTVPIMVGLMLGAHRFSQSLQRRLPAVMASLVILIGVFTIVGRAPVTVGQDLYVASGIDDVTNQIQNVDQSTLPCCDQ